MNGNKIVGSFEEHPNSVVIGDNIPVEIISRANKYVSLHPDATI